MNASVIVVCYNNSADLPDCLNAILRELGPEDELIIVDNGSIDGSADFVAACYPQVRLIRGENSGYAGGNNCGAAAASGEFLVFLNPDTALAHGALAELIEPLKEIAAIGMTTARVVHMNRPALINTCGNTMHYTGLTYCRGAGQPASRYAESADVDAVSGAAFAMRRSLFEALGGFDARFFMYVEDTDLSWRARLAGYRCRYVAGAVVAHNYRPAYSPTKAYLLDRNRHLMLLKNLQRTTYLRMLPGLLLGEIVTGGFLLLKGTRFWGVKPQVYRWLWRHRRAIGAARQAAQMQQRRSDRELVGTMTHRLEFQQLAGPVLARAAAMVLHPAFWLARLLFAQPHNRPSEVC